MITVLLPAYNEEAPLPGLLDRFADSGGQFGDDWRVLIVNDGSSDRTAEAAMEHALGQQGKVAVVNHERNMGLARAMDTGIAAFLEKAAPGDILVTMDADDTHGPEYIPGMLEKIRGGADVVIASRFFPGGREVGVSFFRKIMSRGALLFMRTVAPVPGVSDYSCGYRAYRMEILKLAAETFDRLIVSEGFSVMTEILVRLHALGAVIREVPFTLRYDRKMGPSKIRFARTIHGYFLLRGIAREAEKTGRRQMANGEKIKRKSVEQVKLWNGFPPEACGNDIYFNRKTEKPANRVLVITATYNERENIERLVPRIFELAPDVEVLVVDDNSPDGTGEAAEEFRKQYTGLHVLRREGKLGYGTALLAGIAWARDAGFDAVVTMDADFSHDPAALPDLIAAGREAPVVVGARYVPGGRTVNWGFHRRLLSWGGNTFARLLLGMPVSDVTTGYRYLDLEAIRPARIENVAAKGYGFLIETLFRIVSAGVRTAEVPITFADREYGKSKMSGNIIAEAFLLVLKLWWGKHFGRREQR